MAQSCDGASVMSGHLNGVQELFREKSGTPCIYVHCYAHRVNLVLVDACHVVRAVGDLFGLLEAVHNFITASSLRHDKLQGSIVMSSVGQRPTASDDSHCQYEKRQMFEILDKVTGELTRRFQNNEPLLLSCDAVNPNSDFFMEFAVMKPLAEAYS